MEYCKYCMRPLKNGNAGFCSLCGKNLSAPVPEHHLPPGTVLDRKYELGAALGEGGFGITYIARDTRLDLRVAVKEFYPYGFVSRMAAVSATVSGSTNEEQKAFFEKGRVRFLQEAQTLARFSGEPGIVDVRDFFEENNTAYIVMEYLEGETLRDHLKKTGRLTPEATLLLLTPVMRSLSRLHKENLIHRDISPDNVMLTKSGVKLLDFGAARFVEGDNKSLSVMLKPGYAPEEQYRTHGQQGPWTDVYALCATMYRCITGVRPDEASERMYEDRLQPPSRLGVAIDPAFEAALLKGLAVRGKDRWQTIDDLLAAIPEKPTVPPVPQPKRPDVTQTAFTPTIDHNPRTIPEKTPPQGPPKIKNEENPSEPDSPEAADEPQNTDNRGVKIALGVVAALVVMVLIVIAVTSGKNGTLRKNGSEVGESSDLSSANGKIQKSIEDVGEVTTKETTTVQQSTTQAPPANGTSMQVQNEMRLRAGPSTTDEYLGTVPRNAWVTVETTQDNWAYIYYEGVYGWVYSQDAFGATQIINDDSVSFSVHGNLLENGYEYKITAKNQSSYNIIGFTLTIQFLDEMGNVVDEQNKVLNEVFKSGSSETFTITSDIKVNEYNIEWEYSSYSTAN